MGHYTLTLENWAKQGIKLFNTTDRTKWRFICPNCGDIIIGNYRFCERCEYATYEYPPLTYRRVIDKDGEEIPVFEFAEGK